MRSIKSGDFDVALVDLHMPGISGMEFCRMVRTVESGGAGKSTGLRAWASMRSSSAASPNRVKMLLHATAAGGIKSDELEVRSQNQS